MSRCRGDMTPSWLLALLAALSMLAPSHGGPVGPLPNVTSADMGLNEGSCAVGDVVYLAGDEFPGTTPCERCRCARDGVTCARTTCQPRPGCKALHRPDQCCPIYQCECEQAGRVYGNGEKLVDPLDPCRVCYCQGGEVVCRRIACFVRDDCTPRLVPGRCCPEYDNCPLRGVTSLPGMTPAPSIAPIKLAEPAALPPKDDTPKITIKEITPVSEIPVTTDVKIKEILPSPSIEVPEYSSSKSPLITREATSEKTASVGQTKPEPDAPSVIEIHSTEITSDSKQTDERKRDDDAPPSKINLSTQDSINSDIYPSNVPIVATMGVPASADSSPEPAVTASKAPMIEEDDSSLFVDHNPFPPLPDDLSVLSNHGDEIVPEPSADTDQILVEPAPTPEVIIASVTPLTQAESKEQPSTTFKYFPDTSVTTTEKVTDMSTPTTETTTVKIEATSTEAPALKETPTVKLRSAIPTESIPASSEVARHRQEVVSLTTEYKEALSTATSTTKAASTVTSTTTPATTETSTSLPISTVPSTTEAATTVMSTTKVATTLMSTTGAPTTITSTSTAAAAITSTTTEATEPPRTAGSTTPAPEPTDTPVAITGESKSIEDMSIEFPVKPKKIDEDATEESKVTKKLEALTEDRMILKASEEVTTDDPEFITERVSFFGTSGAPEPDTTLRSTDASTTQQSSTTSQEQTTSSIAKSNAATEVTFQTELSSFPIETSDQNPHDVSENVSNETPEVSSDESFTTINKFSSPSAEVITVAKANEKGENVETTEFVLTSFGSSESATDAVELIKISGDSDKHAAIIDHSDSNKNALTDLIRLVSDVASISDHTEAPVTLYPFAATTGAESEELIPVNAGYKSKNSNFNQNSITEVPSFKAKGGAPATKQKVVEIEDEEDGGITDSPPPNDRAEPTTRRPIIDTVTDEQGERRSDKKDIEIITQSYVPTLSRRPPRVEVAPDQPPAPAPAPPAPPHTSPISIF